MSVGQLSLRAATGHLGPVSAPGSFDAFDIERQLYPAAVNELADELGEALLVVLGALSQRAVEGMAQVEQPGELGGAPGARGRVALAFAWLDSHHRRIGTAQKRRQRLDRNGPRLIGSFRDVTIAPNGRAIRMM